MDDDDDHNDVDDDDKNQDSPCVNEHLEMIWRSMILPTLVTNFKMTEHLLMSIWKWP